MSVHDGNDSKVLDVYHDQSQILKELLTHKYVFFHNLSYDGNFIIKLLQKEGWKEYNQCKFFRGFNQYDVTMIGRDIYRITLYVSGNSTTIIKDSLRFLQCKVADMPKRFGLAGIEKT